MRKTLPFLGATAALALLVAGCTGAQNKLGRGVSNTFEVTRVGELERAQEQGNLFAGTDTGYGQGLVTGVSKTVSRTGLGVFEIVTFPIPPYRPIWTNYLTPKPAHPDSYTPHKWAEPWNATDHYFGFSGGDVAPWFFGSRFTIFDN